MADTTLPQVPLSLLDAVNTLLRSVGLAEVDSLLDTDANVDSQNAFNALARANAQIQAGGWHGNTESLTFTPDSNGHVAIPPNFLGVQPTRQTTTWLKRVTVRGGLLYSLTDHTNLWTSTVYLDIIQALDFTDLPEALRWYITCRAGRQFAIGTYPSAGTFRFTEEEENKAKANAEAEDEDQRDSILPETSPFFGKMRRR